MNQTSNSSTAITHWTKDHFLCFLLLYASHADYDYSTDEEIHINSLFPNPIYQDANQVFDSQTEYQQLQTILHLKERFITSDKEKADILLLLKDLFRADGHISRPENNLLHFLSKLF